MKRKFLKALSYIFEIPIKRYKSETSGWVRISLDRGQYKLSALDAIYSFGKNYKSFKSAFEVIDWSKQTAENVLVLGYGLGSITALLEEKIAHAFSIIGIDIDEKCLLFSKKANAGVVKAKPDLICIDAMEFLQSIEKQFDVICSDIFINDKTPNEYCDKNFVRLLLKQGTDNCLFFLSKLNLDEERQEPESTV